MLMSSAIVGGVSDVVRGDDHMFESLTAYGLPHTEWHASVLIPGK